MAKRDQSTERQTAALGCSVTPLNPQTPIGMNARDRLGNRVVFLLNGLESALDTIPAGVSRSWPAQDSFGPFIEAPRAKVGEVLGAGRALLHIDENPARWREVFQFVV